MQYVQHMLSSAFPAMSADEFDGLLKDIDAEGQRDPAIVASGDEPDTWEVLDGWHRVKACIQLGIEPKVTVYQGDDPVGLVISKNMHRRHLTASQRAAAITACSEWRDRGAPGNSASKADLGSDDNLNAIFEEPKSSKELADMAGVGVRHIERAKEVQRKDPEMAKKVRDGEISLNAAAAALRGGAEPAKSAPKAELGDSAARIAELEEQVAELKDQLAEMASSLEIYADIEDGKDMVAALEQQKAYSRSLEAVRDDLMRQCNALKAEVKGLRRKLPQ